MRAEFMSGRLSDWAARRLRLCQGKKTRQKTQLSQPSADRDRLGDQKARPGNFFNVRGRDGALSVLARRHSPDSEPLALWHFSVLTVAATRGVTQPP